MIDSLGDVLTILGIVTLISGAWLIIRSRATTTTVEAQKNLIDTLVKSGDLHKAQIEELMCEQKESARAVANLQGQVDVLKTIPLKEIATDMKILGDTQHEIIKLLKSNGKGA